MHNLHLSLFVYIRTAAAAARGVDIARLHLRVFSHAIDRAAARRSGSARARCVSRDCEVAARGADKAVGRYIQCGERGREFVCRGR